MSSHIRKPTICIGKNKGADLISCVPLINAFVLTTQIVQSLFLTPKFLACFCDCTGPFVLNLMVFDAVAHNIYELVTNKITNIQSDFAGYH